MGLYSGTDSGESGLISISDVTESGESGLSPMPNSEGMSPNESSKSEKSDSDEEDLYPLTKAREFCNSVLKSGTGESGERGLPLLTDRIDSGDDNLDSIAKAATSNTSLSDTGSEDGAL